MLEMLKEGQVPEAKEEFDELLSEEVVEPLAKRGYPNVGAGIAAGTSAVADFAIPDSAAEAGLMAAGPLGKLAKPGAKALKPIFKSVDEVVPTSSKYKIGSGIKQLDESPAANARSLQLEKLKKAFLD